MTVAAPPPPSLPEARAEAAESRPSLDNLLSEFDKTAPAKPEPKNDPLRLHEPLTQEHAILYYLASIEHERIANRDRRDFELAAQEATKAVADAPNLPKDYARLRMEQWARNEYATNSEFQQAWDNRFSNPEAARYVTKTVNKAIGNLKKEVQSRPPALDVEATEDRKAVVAAMFRGGNSQPPVERAPDYANMNDAEFAAAKAKLGL